MRILSIAYFLLIVLCFFGAVDAWKNASKENRLGFILMHFVIAAICLSKGIKFLYDP